MATASVATPARADECTAPDNGSGTVDLPADCPWTAPYEPMYIREGLPPDTTIELDPILDDFSCQDHTVCSVYMPPGVCEQSGGSLGGEVECFESTLDLTVTGTGVLEGFSRHLSVPVSLEVHTGPRTPGEPVQTFASKVYRMHGQLFGDPDFCEFIITAGTDYGLPGTGQTTLTQLPTDDFAVDSFFDITYQIQFEGCPGSPLDGYMGTTTDVVRMTVGIPPPPTGACCLSDGSCSIMTEGDCLAVGTYLGDDTICLGDYNGDGLDDACDPDMCIAPDNGSGTVDLPADCSWTAPDGPMYIREGLPPDTTIELDPTLLDFYCQDHTVCSVSMPPGVCEQSGGSLGGEVECFESTLDLTLTGTGDLEGFSRHLSVPVSLEVHTGPRTPGEPVQTFASKVYRMHGQLFGDPDFCEFIVTAGTDYGLPGAGYTALTELPSDDFAVDSFFDITYQIEFEGCPGSVLDGFAGTTTETVRLIVGHGQQPGTGACCLPDWSCAIMSQADCLAVGTYHGDGTTCLGDGNGNSFDDLCEPENLCAAPDNGSGTVDLPADCPWTAPDEPMYIREGLPPDTTIELDPILDDFSCQDHTVCSVSMPSGVCEQSGGSLGGEVECFESTLDLTVTGTGDLEGFSRHLSVPVSLEVHTGARNPGSPVQRFVNVVYRMHGQLFGDPDFCEFIMTAGTDYGLPSPGHTTLTQLPSGDFAVDSFFDITYQIEFEGCPGSVLDGFAGTTTETVRMIVGRGALCPGDLDGDGFRNITDFTRFAAAYNSQLGDPNYNPDADLNGDGFVNITDFTIFAGYYLVPCP